MYIAVCDDNVADRKHLERLLSRESDKRAGTPFILYVDSYSTRESLMENPLKYNLFIIDMTATPTIAKETVLELKRLKVSAPIVMFISTIDYSQDKDLPEDIVFMHKPYIPDPLPEILKLGDQNVFGEVVTVTFKINGIKQMIPVQDIYYAMAEGENTRIVLDDNLNYLVEQPLIDVYNLLEPYDVFFLLKKNLVINVKLTAMITPFTVMMLNYKEFHYNPFKHNSLLELKYKIEDELN